jgi:FKBP-type peptidyl-prolyl cis-trans isomerase 2
MVHYTIRLDDGALVDSSSQRGPLSIRIGEGNLFPVVEQALVGLGQGERAAVRVPAEHAFGPYAPELVMVVDRAYLPTGVEPEVGMQLEARGADGAPIRAGVTAVDGARITLDGNHPLAGRPLNIEVQIVSLL